MVGGELEEDIDWDIWGWVGGLGRRKGIRWVDVELVEILILFLVSNGEEF